ncbi:hypothetical protein [Anaerobacillus alkalilacustris]|nr:hypothetical protein [Anaerobacillus alkalilacustris]
MNKQDEKTIYLFIAQQYKYTIDKLRRRLFLLSDRLFFVYDI